MSANDKHRPEHYKKGVSNERVSPSRRCVLPSVKAAHSRKLKPNKRVDVRTGRIFLSAQGLVNMGMDRYNG